MINRFFPSDDPKGLVRQNSALNLDEDSERVKQMRQMRQINSVNKQLGTKKQRFFFQEGQKIVGGYKFDVRKQIGAGYSSKVYKALSIKDNLQYAIKAIQFKNFRPSHIKMLQNQIRILRKMSHPNVVRFQSVSKTTTHLYIVTEFCQRGDLLTYMTRNGVLQEKQALSIFADILRGMQYLQRSGVIHRDIKPGNIIYNGKSWKIADFGFAIQSKEEIKTRNNVGTPLYMPLQSLQKNLYSAQSDIFSVGVVLYELLVGITPWQCRDQQELIRKLNNVEFRFPQKSKISPQIKQLLKRLCQPLKQNRMTGRQFLSLDPSTFKNQQTSANIFKNQIIQEANNQKRPLDFEKKISKQNLNSQIKEQTKYLRQMVQQMPKNQLNQFAAEKIKKSIEHCEFKPQITPKSLKKVKSVSNLLTPKSQQNRPNQGSPEGLSNIVIKDQSQKTNRSVLLSLLNFCRFMYYLLKNSQHLELNQPNKDKIKTILLKHAISLLKQLSDSKNNWFGLQNYHIYVQTKNYLKIYSSFQEYLSKYEKQYESLLRKVDNSVVGQIDQKIYQFTNEQGCLLDQAFYQKVLNFITPILRQNNHNLASQIIANKKKLVGETKYKIEAIKNFYKYYRLIQILSQQNTSYQYFEQNSHIEVVKTYNQTTSTIQEYMNLRKEMKYI